jgi:hypothetical protein
MVVRGHVQNGVVVLDSGPALPEGAAVTVTFAVQAEPPPAAPKKRVQVPLVRTNRPGTMNLTNERIGEILDGEDAAPRH